MSLPTPAVKNGRKFLNPVPTTVGGFSTMLKALPLLLTNRAETEPREAPGPFHTPPSAYTVAPAGGLRITWFGHSSSLVEIDGFRVLLDPVWDQRASPVSFLGPRRFFAPTIALADLPPVDAVLVSHDHYDHLGAETHRTLAALPAFASTRWITSLGVGRHFCRFGIPAERITELDWTQSTVLRNAAGSGLRFTSCPARHFSGRGLRDRFTTLWASFVLEGPEHRLYFGADTGPWDGLAETAARYPGFDLVMLEIGAYHPLWWQIHLGPDAAAEAFRAMAVRAHCPRLMPIHWGLFNLAMHAWRQPMERMEELAAAGDLPLWSPEPGVPTEVGQPFVSGWWRDTLSR